MKLVKKILVLVLIGVLAWGLWGIWGRLGKELEGQGGQETKEGPVRFAVMGDIHGDWENFKKALEKAKEGLGPAFAESDSASARQRFVVVLGDLATIGKKSELVEAKKILDESGLKYFVIPGNHDIWWGRQYKRDVWGEVFGKSFGSFKEGKIKFILVNNGDGVNGAVGIMGKIGPASPAKRGEEIREKQGDWLKEEVEECLKIYCLVFMHIPLNHPNSLHVMGEGNPEVASEATELIKLLVKNQVKEVFAGHLHFSSEYELDGLKTTIVGAITSERNFQSPKFMEVLVGEKAFEKKDIFLND